MSLSNAIKSGKEHRTEYGIGNQPYCKSIDKSCRNHRDCPWCQGNRTFKNKSKDKLAKQEIINYRKEDK